MAAGCKIRSSGPYRTIPGVLGKEIKTFVVKKSVMRNESVVIVDNMDKWWGCL